MCALSDAFVAAATGPLPEGVRLWTVLDGKQQLEEAAAANTRRRSAHQDEQWKTRPVTVTLLQSESSVQTQTERLRVPTPHHTCATLICIYMHNHIHI